MPTREEMATHLTRLRISYIQAMTRLARCQAVKIEKDAAKQTVSGGFEIMIRKLAVDPGAAGVTVADASARAMALGRAAAELEQAEESLQVARSEAEGLDEQVKEVMAALIADFRERG